MEYVVFHLSRLKRESGMGGPPLMLTRTEPQKNWSYEAVKTLILPEDKGFETWRGTKEQLEEKLRNAVDSAGTELNHYNNALADIKGL